MMNGTRRMRIGQRDPGRVPSLQMKSRKPESTHFSNGRQVPEPSLPRPCLINNSQGSSFVRMVINVPRRALLLVNKKSRSGESSLDTLLARFHQAGIQVQDEPLTHPGAIPELIRMHASQVDCVILGGGDGSMSSAAPALIETGLPLGILPMGTANDLARTLQIPIDLPSACDIIAGGTVHQVDVGCVNGRHFFNVANIGLGVTVKRLLTPDMKQRWGVLSYARCMLQAIRDFQPFYADIVCDGKQQWVRSLQIAVGNGRHYGGGMTVAEEASLEDSRFHLYSIRPMDWWNLAKIGPSLKSGEFQPDHPVDLVSGFDVTIRTRKPMVVTADGESVTVTPAHFRILPKAVKIIVPVHYLEQKEELDHAA